MLPPEGFGLARGWAFSTMMSDVLDEVEWNQDTIRLFGRDVLQPRQTSWMGTGSYTYSGRAHHPARMPEVIIDLRERVQRATGTLFNSVLANHYRDGRDSVSWHADDEPELGPRPVIASLSLGATRQFQIRHNTTRQRWDVELAHGDLLVMSGNSQRDYQHAVPKTRRPVGPRVNLTFRTVTV